MMTRIFVALFILWPAAAYALSNSPYGQLFTVTAQSIQLVQSQYIAHSSASNQQCHWSFPAIGTGDTVIGYIHSSNNMDNYMLVPSWIKDNTGTTYTMTPTAEWRPWREGITLFYLTNVQKNPTSFTIDFSSYPAHGQTILGACNIGFSEYSGVNGLIVAGPTLVSNTTSPSISVSPTSQAKIWAFAADYGGGTNSLQNSGYTGIIDNTADDDIGVWQSNTLISAGPLTLTWNAPNGGVTCSSRGPLYRLVKRVLSPLLGGYYHLVSCPTMLAAVALQTTPPP
jgi:hypothetical protein